MMVGVAIDEPVVGPDIIKQRVQEKETHQKKAAAAIDLVSVTELRELSPFCDWKCC
jgi:ABC-type Na+ transport system ATPase subunit NatA